MADTEENKKIDTLAGDEGWQDELSLCDRQKKLFLNDFLSDVTFFVGLIVDPEEQKSISSVRLHRIPAHKFILATSNQVFQAMFFGPLAKASDQSEVKVLDMEPEAFIAILR